MSRIKDLQERYTTCTTVAFIDIPQVLLTCVHSFILCDCIISCNDDTDEDKYKITRYQRDNKNSQVEEKLSMPLQN